MTDSNFVVKRGLDVFDGDVSLKGSNKELRFYEGSNYVGFEAPALTADKIWVLPNADGSTGQALKTDGSGNLGWVTAGDVTLTGTQTLTNKTLTDPTIRLASAYSTTPALSFTGDTDTGITHNGGNGFSFIHGGSVKTTFASTGLKINSSTYKIHADGSDKLNIWGGYDGSAAVRINDNYDLPITDGSANQVIQTNGNGTLSFATAGGDSWGDVVDAHIIPDTDDTYDIGALTTQFRNAYFDGTVRTDNLTVDSQASVAANISLGGGSYTSPSFTFIDDNDCGMGREDTNAIFLGTGGSPRLKIYSDGAVDLVNSKLKIGNSYGSDGQVLTSTGSGVAWEDAESAFETITDVTIGSGTSGTTSGIYFGANNEAGIVAGEVSNASTANDGYIELMNMDLDIISGSSGLQTVELTVQIEDETNQEVESFKALVQASEKTVLGTTARAVNFTEWAILFDGSARIGTLAADYDSGDDTIRIRYQNKQGSTATLTATFYAITMQNNT